MKVPGSAEEDLCILSSCADVAIHMAGQTVRLLHIFLGKPTPDVTVLFATSRGSQDHPPPLAG